MKTPINPQALLQKIENNEPLDNDYTVQLYEPTPSSWYNAETDQAKLSEQKKALLKLLKHPKCPENLKVHITVTNDYGSFSHTSRTRTPIKPIFDTLAKGGCPKGLKIKIDTSTLEQGTYLNRNEIEALENALMSGNCPEDLELDLGTIYNSRYEKGPNSDQRMKGEVPFLILALQRGKGPFGLAIKYKKPERLYEGDSAQFDILEKILKNNDFLHIKTEMQSINTKIITKLEEEISSLKARNNGEMGTKVQKRLDVLVELKSSVENITKSHMANIKPDQRDAWKRTYKENLQEVINESLKKEELAKYDDSQKFKIKLLNIVTVIFSPIKYAITGSFFYSTEGKSKEAVQEALKISESIVNKK